MNLTAILGTGVMAGAVARALVRGKIRLAIGSRDVARAEGLAAVLRGASGAAARGDDYAGAVAGADVVVLAVDYEHAPAIIAALGGALTGKTIVDPTTPWGDAVPATSGAEELARLLPSGATLV